MYADHTPLLTLWVPAPDSMAVLVCLIWLAVSTSILRVVGYPLMSILIVGTFRLHDLFHCWGAPPRSPASSPSLL